MHTLKLTTKIADQSWELEEICRLNHQTFSEEIPQHSKSENGLLIDKFHKENTYVICKHEDEIIGLVALRCKRPFSLDFKLDNIENYLPPHSNLCEIRLLIVKPQYRGTQVFFYLFKKAFHEFIKNKYDYAVISGILTQQKLYRNMGFVPFGPLVGDDLKFQPMYASSDFFQNSKHKKIAQSLLNKTINVLPGPVDIKDIIRKEYHISPESHRSEDFKDKYSNICNNLCNYVKVPNVQLFTGSGTLANEVILAHLSTLSLKGLIISNGEFGNRLIHQAKCLHVDFQEYKIDTGETFNINSIHEFLISNDINWLYFVHCETSTGILNDIQELTKMCISNKILVVVDCISTFGIIPLDLSQVYMASASSGKAIGSYSGLSFVFYNKLLESNNNTIPVYLDINTYIQKGGIPFTINSNALYALGSSLEISDVNLKYKKALDLGAKIRNKLQSWNIHIGNKDSSQMHPAIITIQLSEYNNSFDIGQHLESKNILVNYNSDYLIQENKIQLCLFSDLEDFEIDILLNTLKLALEEGKIYASKTQSLSH